ncbi:caspase-1-like isoform X1 [Nilaparvata lugens]|uniref:caspase-1-like isoform X1 n=1 Tax=Nilaparvata lugens TaxID=108931 RepID=UPI00193D2EC2|nr:caspase-1-like isoform X1 [Nilaparvata lugens]XP_039277596.1 caspase-1-like isoform X1 [Nilaparvata lugens]XP_039277597.1 caspase-1-like isoform X1 [Nilaparvata lugens]XP_039277598.1 caspase-1-like isoform X1 [Nilaparvata lugens]XP_039277599.1 caspase-1-like isoform X1 [Nilaparvata lugens]XP_039277600.1 caspase-1-like isoform X1 [Nilaparvata lugens]XP_039277601.1 caspase-1-like isoform X1 [Nilaparvata lugens]
MEAHHSKREGIREDELDSLEANATYNMNHKARGSAIIFNHEHFLENLDQRKGTDVDAFKLRNSLERLGFSVVSYKDRKAEEIENIITEDVRFSPPIKALHNTLFERNQQQTFM